MNKNLKEITVSIEVAASRGTVFAAVTDWENQSNWVLLTKVRGVGTDSHKAGGQIEAFTGFGKIGFLDTMTITNWEDNKLCEVTHTGKVVKGKGIFVVTKHQDGSVFTWTEETEVPFGVFGRMGWFIAKPIIKVSMYASLKRLRRYIEAR